MACRLFLFHHLHPSATCTTETRQQPSRTQTLKYKKVICQSPQAIGNQSLTKDLADPNKAAFIQDYQLVPVSLWKGIQGAVHPPTLT